MEPFVSIDQVLRGRKIEVTSDVGKVDVDKEQFYSYLLNSFQAVTLYLNEDNAYKFFLFDAYHGKQPLTQ